MTKSKKERNDKFKGDLLVKEVFPLNIYPLDFLLKGGIRQSETYQFISESGIGKTTIALQIAGRFCNKGKVVVYVDSESSLDENLLISLSVYEYYQKGTFIYIQESVFSKLEQKLDDLLSSEDKDISLIIIDSIAALIPEDLAKTENGMSITTKDTNSGSRQLTLFLNKYKALSIRNKYSMILINQYRNEIDMKRGAVAKLFGPKNVKYNSDVIIQIKKNTKCYDFKDILAKIDNVTDLVFEVVKSNKNPPGEFIPFGLVYGRGICSTFLDMYAMIKLNIITQSGAWYKYQLEDGEHVSHGINDLFQRFWNDNIVPDSDLRKQIDSYYEENFRSSSIFR